MRPRNLFLLPVAMTSLLLTACGKSDNDRLLERMNRVDRDYAQNPPDVIERHEPRLKSTAVPASSLPPEQLFHTGGIELLPPASGTVKSPRW